MRHLHVPHHAVFRADRQISKCRIKLNAFALEQDSVSLIVLLGPVLQPNLVLVLICFHTHSARMIADVEMY